MKEYLCKMKPLFSYLPLSGFRPSSRFRKEWPLRLLRTRLLRRMNHDS